MVVTGVGLQFRYQKLFTWIERPLMDVVVCDGDHGPGTCLRSPGMIDGAHVRAEFGVRWWSERGWAPSAAA